MTFIRTALAIGAGLILCGCSTTITNLTPSHEPRNPNNLYPLEVSFHSSQKSIQDGSITPYVLVGNDKYPMQPTPMVKNRWEALIPVPGSTNYIYYRYKFDYKYDRIPHSSASSRLSPTYQLEIVDK